MKKFSRTIAMILVLVMLASSFTSCTFLLPFITRDGHFDEDDIWMFLGGLCLDALLVFAIIFGVNKSKNSEAPNETGIYLANAEHDPLMDYSSAMEIFNSLPETERVTVMDKLNSLPAEKCASLVRTVTSLPQAEITASIERLNALSEAELVSTVQDFNVLTETEFDLLTDKLNEKAKSLPSMDYVALVAVSP